MTRRWRGTIDVPPTEDGLKDAMRLGGRLRLGVIYHDSLSRCRRTAVAMSPYSTVETDGPRPWKMGPLFEGHEITPESIINSQWQVENPWIFPLGGEQFGRWLWDWKEWISMVDMDRLLVRERKGVVTHNRNIQALYSRHSDTFYPKLYNAVGPSPLTVHVYSKGHIAPWNGKDVPGLYLIRHAPTEWGT